MAESVLEASRVSLGIPKDFLMEGGAPSGRVLPFRMQHQEQTQWCWAAVTASVADFYNQPGWRQCQIVETCRGTSGCCTQGSSSACNQPWFLDQSLSRTGDLSDYLARSLSWSEVQAEIEAGRPVGVRIGWPMGGHFVAIDGYSGTGTLDIQDPWFNHSTVSYQEFRTAYLGNGKWSHSYRTRAGSGTTPVTPSPPPVVPPKPVGPPNPWTPRPTGPPPVTPVGPPDPWQPSVPWTLKPTTSAN
jgi:hypothetical protein